MSKQFDDARIQPPGGDDESLREYGRQLAMDSLLELALGDRGMMKASPRPAGLRRRWVAITAAALAASLLLGVCLWQSLRSAAPPIRRELATHGGLAPDQQPSKPAPGRAEQPASARLTPDEIRALPPTDWGYQQAARSSPEDLAMFMQYQADTLLPDVSKDGW
jgi:hypothetical protein